MRLREWDGGGDVLEGGPNVRARSDFLDPFCPKHCALKILRLHASARTGRCRALGKARLARRSCVTPLRQSIRSANLTLQKTPLRMGELLDTKTYGLSFLHRQADYDVFLQVQRTGIDRQGQYRQHM